MLYIIFSIFTIILVIVLIDKKRLIEFIPAYLLSSVIGFSLDAIFDVTLKYYFYYEPPIPNGVLILLMEVFIGPLYGILYTQYLPRNKKILPLYISLWIIFLVFIEGIFHIKGLLLYYNWNYFYSILTYIFTLLFILLQHRYLISHNR